MPLRVLVLEDNPDDAELVMRELARSGLPLEWKRVWTPEQYDQALAQGSWDVILADYSLPRFDAVAALKRLQATGQDLPFIIVSGAIGEDAAVGALKAGAHDFLSKNNLARLGPAVAREVREARVRGERGEAVARLHEVEARHKRMVEAVRDYAIFMLDPKGRVASWNPGAERVLGYTAEEIVGRPFAQLLTAKASAGDEHLHALAIADEHGTFNAEGYHRRQDGSHFWAACTLDPIREGERLIGYSVVIRDTTERKQLVDDLRQAVRMREDFLSVASHELKTPLTSLHLLLDTYGRALAAEPTLPANSPKLTAKWEAIHRQVDRLTTLVEVLLDVDRISTGQLRLERERLELGEVAVSVVARLQPLIEAAGCQVSLQRKALVYGQWDRVRLETIVSNLLSNALKYAPGKPIDLVVDVEGPNARLAVTDHGIGLPRAEQERIFEQFERAVPATHYGGLGLGLWIARQSTRAHGGTIQVTSRPGEGATFTVLLPREVELTATPGQPASP